MTIQELIERFSSNQSEYEDSGYLESQLRTDFIDELFKGLGWDIVNKNKLSRLQREVLVERGDTTGRPDYSFRVNGQDRFFVETKAPSKGTNKPEDIFQAKSYGWNTTSVNIVVLTDFRSFKVFDTTIKPDLNQPQLGLIFELEFENFTINFDELWLFSKEEVVNGSLDKLSSKDPTSKRYRIPVDAALIDQMTLWRNELARDVYKHNPVITVRELNDVVQRLLDRLIFIRLLEDRKIIDFKTLKEIVDTWKEGRHREIQAQLNLLFKQLNNDFNGEIFKEHPCEKIPYSSALVAEIINGLYFPKSPYNFAVIGVELLGTIYEKYLGKTIRLTEKRANVEEKPEVRKAGGVYYTPKWVVSHIVENTVGKLVEGKSPKQIESIHILDPACGSGSFLIEAINHLFEYHLKYYESYPSEAKLGELFPNVVVSDDEDGNPIPRLSIYKKSEILENNIFGIDIDPQAVEVTMMSLYIKILEGERALPHNKELLPSLSNNIRCGNSLIGFDFFEQKTLVEEVDREKVNPFDWNSRATGFGRIITERKGFDAIIGNPPYVRSILLREEPKTWEYYKTHYDKTVFKEFDIYLCFLQKAYSILAPDGRLGFIMPNKWLHAEMGQAARTFFQQNQAIETLVNFGSFQVFKEVTTYTMLIFLHNRSNECIQFLNYVGSADAKNISLDFDDEANWQKGSVKYSLLDKRPWNLVTGKAQDIFSKLLVLPKFGEYFSLAQGTGTRADSVFFVRKISEEKNHYNIFSRQTQKEYYLEKTFLKPSAKGKDIDSYELKNNNQLLIFPYNRRNLVDKKDLQVQSPNLWKYLEECRAPLEERENGRWKGDNFYCYGRPQNHDILPLKKILVPVVVNRAKAAWDSEGLHVIDSVYFVKRIKQSNIADEYVLALLNSSLLTYFLMKTSSNLRGGYFSMKPGYVDRFPLKADFSNKEEKETYELIIKLVTRINTISSNRKSDILERELLILKERLDDMIIQLYGLEEEKPNIESLVNP